MARRGSSYAAATELRSYGSAAYDELRKYYPAYSILIAGENINQGE